ncbi:NACHT domain-containing protein [Streptomyces tubercidicus]|uniref:NACHT domain-containing protein n=1 Tax=Streptomyces tubercidicus TaxID=47759 RepID=UPI0032485323
MGREDIAAFIQRWHRAAAQRCPADLDRLGHYERTPLNAVRITRDLGRLATNPLMCGLLCALHRDRRGYLPHGRNELYDAALSMLLERRDRERAMVPTDGVELTRQPKIQLLQKLAHWMLVNGRSELDQATAVDTLAQYLPAIPDAARQGGPEDVFRHLLNRTGLLREPTPGAVDFVHRTFQDYLTGLRDRAHHEVRAQLAGAWRRHDTARYAREIISHLEPAELYFPASDLEELHTLRRLGGRPHLRIAGSFTPDQLLEGIAPAEGLTRLWLTYDLGVSMEWLAAFPHLDTLRISRRIPPVSGVPEGIRVVQM